MRYHLAALILYPIFASLISFLLEADFLVSLIIFYLVPGIYLSFIYPKAIKKAALFSLIFGAPIYAIIDYLAIKSGAWQLHSATIAENILWGVFGVYFLVMFYEYFFDRENIQQLFSPRIKFLTIAVAAVLGIFFAIFAANPDLLKIDYFYLKSGIAFALVPVVLTLLFLPKLSGKFLKTAAYFAILNLTYELTALSLNQWSFPGDQFIGKVVLFGKTFPFEELFFFILLGSLALLSYYEFFADDRK